MAAGEPFHYYFCHYEGHPEAEEQPVVDLSGDACRVAAGRITVRALSAELKRPGAAQEIMPEILEACPTQWQSLFATQCDAGPEALKCAIEFIAAQAHFLRTPSIEPLENDDPIELLMQKAQL